MDNRFGNRSYGDDWMDRREDQGGYRREGMDESRQFGGDRRQEYPYGSLPGDMGHRGGSYGAGSSGSYGGYGSGSYGGYGSGSYLGQGGSYQGGSYQGGSYQGEMGRSGYGVQDRWPERSSYGMGQDQSMYGRGGWDREGRWPQDQGMYGRGWGQEQGRGGQERWGQERWGQDRWGQEQGRWGGEPNFGDRVKHAMDRVIDRGEELLTRAGEGIKQVFQGKGPKGWTRSDSRIQEDVCDCLTDNPQVDASNIEVRVENGEVTLTGSVEDRRTKILAERVVEDVRGVKDVHNQLRVMPSTGTSVGTSTTGSMTGTSLSGSSMSGLGTSSSSTASNLGNPSIPSGTKSGSTTAGR